MNAKPSVFLGIAVTLLVMATLFATTQDAWRASSAVGIAPNVLAGMASLGFAVAGGLSLIAAALASWNRIPPTQ